MMTAALLLKAQLVLIAALVVLLLAMPLMTIRLLGLPVAATAFWPRLTGALLLAIGVAALATDQGWVKAGTGLGIGGFVAINLSFAFVLVSQLALGAPIPFRRGRLVLWLLAALFALLGFTEIAFAG